MIDLISSKCGTGEQRTAKSLFLTSPDTLLMPQSVGGGVGRSVGPVEKVIDLWPIVEDTHTGQRHGQIVGSRRR